MTSAVLRPRVFVADLIQPGDILLTTTPDADSQLIRRVTKSDISHAMVCVANSSVVDSTGEGVHARNLQRIILESGCAGHVLRPVTPLSVEQLRQVIAYARAAVGTRYTVTGAAKSVLPGRIGGRKQFCSRLVAQAYRAAGVHLVQDADYCSPGEILKSKLLVEVPDVLRELTIEEEAYWRGDTDKLKFMRDSINSLLKEARKLSPEIESLNDIDVYLTEHFEANDLLVHALHASKYLTLWQDEVRRNAWQYDVGRLEAFGASQERKRWYCETLLAEEDLGVNRFVSNHAGYVTLATQYRCDYLDWMVGLYGTLAELHAKRVKAASSWLERNGFKAPAPAVLLRPHTAEWFLSLQQWNPKQAALTAAVVQQAEGSEVCSVCGDEPALDYALVNPPPAGPGTIRLCEFCFKYRSAREEMKPF